VLGPRTLLGDTGGPQGPQWNPQGIQESQGYPKRDPGKAQETHRVAKKRTKGARKAPRNAQEGSRGGVSVKGHGGEAASKWIIVDYNRFLKVVNYMTGLL